MAQRWAKTLSREMSSAANIISLSRIPLAIIAITIFENKVLLFCIFALTCVTDGLDGWFARRQGSTKYGPIIDPLADKAFFAIIFIYLLVTGKLGWWLLLLLLLRDIFVVLMSIYVMLRLKREKMMKLGVASFLGKIVTACQFITILWLVTGLPGFETGAYAAAITGIAASIEYVLRMRRTVLQPSQ